MAEAGCELHVSAATNCGNVRHTNEDAIAVGGWLGYGENASFVAERVIDRAELLLAVADGLGGHRAGEVASRLLVKQLSERFIADALQPPDARAGLLHEIDANLKNRALDVPSLRGMGSTLAAAYISRDWLTIFNVGDSRVYLWDNAKELRQISVDHVPLVVRVDKWDAPLFIDEIRSPGFRRSSHAVTQAFGGHGRRSRPLEPHNVRLPVTESSWTLLLCSDGLSDFVEEAELQRAVACDVVNADGLVRRALDDGGGDNVSVILARYRPTATLKA